MSDSHADKHPDERQYVKVAVFLAVVTAAEVAVSYIAGLGDLIVPLLTVMMIVKFMLVAGWFMHLKFDSRIFRRFFWLGIILSLLVFSVVLWTFTKVITDTGVAG